MVFDESHTFDIFFRDHLSTLFNLAHVFGIGPLHNFGTHEVATVRQIWDHIDSYHRQLENRLVSLSKLPLEDVVVRHQWHGNWRPKEPKAHAVVLLGEAISGAHRASACCSGPHTPTDKMAELSQRQMTSR